MNVTCPAVVPIPGSSPLPWTSARQPSSANVDSPFHRSPSSQTGRCAPSSSALSLNSSCVQLTHRRLISSKKVLLVRARCPASNSGGDVGSSQKSFAVSDNGASWALQNQQEKAFRTESRDLWLSANQHASGRGPSSSSFFPPDNQQRAFSPTQTLPSKSNLTRRQQNRITDPSAASRLQNSLPAFKQAAEPDAFGTSVSPVHGADAFSSFNRQNPSSGTMTQNSHSHGEDTSQNESVFTSKLEEILDKFRTRNKRSSPRDERMERAAPSAVQTDTILGIDWRNAGRDDRNPRSIGSASATSVTENDFNKEEFFFSTARQQRDSRRERRLGMAKGNAGDPSNVVDSSTPSLWEGKGVRSPASKMRRSIRKGSSNFVGEGMTKSPQSSVLGNKGRIQNLDLHDGKQSSGVEELGETGTVSNRFFRSQTDHNSVARKHAISEFDWADSDEEDNLDTVPSITSDDGKEAEQLSSGSPMGIKTCNAKLTRNGRVAAWHSHNYSNLPFEFQYSYSETPKAPIIRYREAPYSPFGPETMARPWTGRPPLKKSKKKLPEFDSFKPPPVKKGIKFVQYPGPFPEGQGPTPARSREEILGEPLTGEEIVSLVDKCQSERRQLNLGRDGLTHNMLDLIHCHWKRRRVVKVRCIGVPTVDMENVCFHLEDKTGGKIIYRSGGCVYLFRGRNYNYKDRPKIPIMLWKPISPVYPKLIKKAPEGLTIEEADKLQLLGRKVEPLCTLAKNGVYLSLVKDVRAAFRIDDLVRINCRGLNPSDYKKIGAKLRDLVPCVLLSFDDEQIVMWKGRARVSANVDGVISCSMEAANGSKLEPEKLLVSCGADDDESDSAREKIKQRSLVIDTDNVSTGRSDCSILAGAEGSSEHSYVTESMDQLSIPHPFEDDLCFEDFRKTVFLAQSEVKSSLPNVSDEEDDIKSVEANPTPEHPPTMPSVEANPTLDVMPGHERESTSASDSQFHEPRRLMNLISSANDREDGRVVPNTAFKMGENSTKLGNSGDIGADSRMVRVDALWDTAIASGIAIELHEIDMDSDVIVKKADELDKAAPAAVEYTRKLQSKLRIKKKTTPKPDDDLRTLFGNLSRARNQKKAAKGFSRSRVVVDVPDNGGLPMDELARILSIK